MFLASEEKQGVEATLASDNTGLVHVAGCLKHGKESVDVAVNGINSVDLFDLQREAGDTHLSGAMHKAS